VGAGPAPPPPTPQTPIPNPQSPIPNDYYLSKIKNKLILNI